MTSMSSAGPPRRSVPPPMGGGGSSAPGLASCTNLSQAVLMYDYAAATAFELTVSGELYSLACSGFSMLAPNLTCLVVSMQLSLIHI